MFDVHKIKPVHGWREFIGEVGIIVLGVLIALALEQVVEWVHWRHQVDRATEAVRSEIDRQYGWAVEWRVSAPCVAAQSAGLRARLLSDEPRLDPAPIYAEPDFAGYVLRLPDRNYEEGMWQVAMSDGAAAHMGATLRRQLVAAYTKNRALAELTAQNEAATERLLVLGTPIQLDPQVRLSLLQELNGLAGRVDFMSFLSGQQIDHWRRAGLLPAPRVGQAAVNGSGTVRFCRTHSFPLRPLTAAQAPITND